MKFTSKWTPKEVGSFRRSVVGAIGYTVRHSIHPITGNYSQTLNQIEADKKRRLKTKFDFSHIRKPGDVASVILTTRGAL